MTVQSRARKDRSQAQVRNPATGSFWKPVSLEDLIRVQGVGLADNLDEFSSLWPLEDDPEELLQFISEQRRTRRGSERD